MKKRIFLEKIENGFYKLIKPCDILYPLYLFLTYGPFPLSYISFLEDQSKSEFYGNVINMSKQNSDVVIEIDENLHADMPTFKINQNILLKILKEYVQLTKDGVEKIEICLDGNIATVNDIS